MRRTGMLLVAVVLIAGVPLAAQGPGEARRAAPAAAEPPAPAPAPPGVQVVGLGERLLAVCEPAAGEDGRPGYRLTAYRLVGDQFVRSGRGFHLGLPAGERR